MGEERRKYKRIYMRLPVEYRGKNIWQQVEVHNISEGGIFVITDKLESPGTPVELILAFGEKEKKMVYVEGTVVWCREKSAKSEEGELFPIGMGIQFRKFSSTENRQFIAEHIKNWDKNGET